jgi:hypothetical protein
METKEWICDIEIPKYIRVYTKSKNVRPKYFIKGKKTLPLMYCNKSLYNTQGVREPDEVNYGWQSFPVIRQKRKQFIDFLVDLHTGERVIANVNDVGKVKMANINGQGIYNGNIAQHERNNMIGAIKDYLRPYIKNIQPLLRFPIRIDCYIFDVTTDVIYSKGQAWDVENRFFPYGKSFHDLLTELKIIPDDNRLYITEPAHPIFVPIEDPNRTRLLFRVYKDNRAVILNDPDYQEYHKERLK